MGGDAWQDWPSLDEEGDNNYVIDYCLTQLNIEKLPVV